MKKIIITKPGCRELANHLWNYLSIYAYGLEAGAEVANPSFSKWHRYFNLQRSPLWRAWSVIDALYGSYVVRAHQKCSLLAVNEIVYLPPTVRRDMCDTTYCIGWFFRNPLGLERHRDALVTAFQPRKEILEEIENALAPLAGKTLIGIQLRQQPYKGLPDVLLVSPERVRQIVEQYMREKKLSADEVALVMVSDKAVESSLFAEFTTHVSHAGEVNNLFLLSKCSVVIGSNSTFSNLAAWFGNVPHLVTTNDRIDWTYYKDKQTYFENTYATFAE